MSASRQQEQLEQTLTELSLDEAQETLRAIQGGEVDAFVLEGSSGPAVYTLKDAHHPYRLIIERMSEGAVVLGDEGTLVYCNRSFADFVGVDKSALLGRPIQVCVAPEHHRRLESLLAMARSAPATDELDLVSVRGPLPVSLSASPIDIDDWKSCITLVVTNLTTRRRIESMAAAEEFTRSVLDQATEPMIVCDANGIVTHASLAAQALCTSTPLGRPYGEAFPLRLPGPGGEDLPFTGKESAQGMEVHMVCRGGELRHFVARDGGLRNAQGHPIGRIVTLNDITDRKQAEDLLRASEARLRLAVDGAHAGIWEWDISTGALTWSEKVYELYGVDPATAPPTFDYWESTVHPDDLPGLKSRREAFLVNQDSEYRDEFRILHPQRGTRWLLSLGTMARAPDQTPLRMYGINIDITEHKEWESELARRVDERTAELMAANQELEGFTYAASHDMKGPLGRINSFCALLNRNYRGQLDGEGLLFIDLVQQNAQRLQTLVDDLLAHVQVGKQPLYFQPVEAAGAVHAVLREYALDLQQKDVEVRLHLPDDFVVYCSPLGLAQVLRNLVGNAIKYSSLAQPPIIEIGGEVQETVCRLWVRDNGIGIDPVYQEKIFEIFRRLHTYSEYPGNGIGLALVRKAMERMGGKVWVESQTGQGATFYLEFSRTPAALEALTDCSGLPFA